MSYFVFVQFIFIIVFIKVTCSEYHSDETYPFLVKIEAKGKILDCAGTILTPCTILTSAHCVEGVDATRVIVSQITTTVIKHEVASTVIHPKYNSTVLANDIALLQIKETFRKPWTAILGWSGHIMKTPMKNSVATDFVEKPMKAPMKLISNENCLALFKNLGGAFEADEGKLCGIPVEEGEEEICFTGPGGPLLCSVQSETITKASPKRDSQIQQDFDKKGILEDPIDLLENFRKIDEKKYKREVEDDVKNLQVGVVSWGKSCSKVPSVYVKTDFYSSWITETARNLTEKCDPNFSTKNDWPHTFKNPLKSRGVEVTCLPVFPHLFLPVTIISSYGFYGLLF